MRGKSRVVLLAGMLLCVLLAFNTTVQVGNVVVKLTNYSPQFKADLSEYKGKRINLADFNNEAKDTTLGYYFSLDRQYAYCGPSFIDNYFWYSFEKALLSLGMLVSDRKTPDPYAPAVWITLRSMTDAKFEVELKLQKFVYGVLFTKTYTVTGEDLPAKVEQHTQDYLEKRAYNMTNKLFETILTDPEFKKIYFKAIADMAPSQGR